MVALRWAIDARTPFLVAALVLAGLWWGSVRLAALDRSVLEAEIGRAALARVEVTGPGAARRVRASGARCGCVASALWSSTSAPASSSRPRRAPPQGAVLEVVATLAKPRMAEEEGDFDEAAYLAPPGHPRHPPGRAPSGSSAAAAESVGSPTVFGGESSSSLDAVPAGERRAVLAGVVLGEDEGLEASCRDSFRASGLYHLLAVSGQNVAYVVAGTILLVWALGLPRWLGEVGALGTVAAYVLAVGWQPSVVRAGVAGGLASLAWLASRPRDRWYFLLVGAAVLLAWNPYSAARSGLPALVRRRRSHLPARSLDRAHGSRAIRFRSPLPM